MCGDFESKITVLPHERIDYLIQERLAIIQSHQVFSFSLDAVLLAAFADIPHTRLGTIVDLCAGNGAVTLMLAARTKNPVIGIELQAPLADMAQRSVALNNMAAQVRVIHGNVADVPRWIPEASVDVVTCNPPYFKVHPQSAKNPNAAVAIARHELTIAVTDWVQASRYMLKRGGKLFCVFRPERLDELWDALHAARFAVKQLWLIHPKAHKKANMVLVEAHLYGQRGGVTVRPPLIVYDESGQYTAEMAAIFDGQ